MLAAGPSDRLQGVSNREADALVVFGITGDLARQSIEQTGEQIDDEVFGRFADRLRYVKGDFGDEQTYARVSEALGEHKHPTFYLEIPPSLFATVVEGLAKAGL